MDRETQMEREIYEKNGRLWIRELNPHGKPYSEEPTNVEIVKDESLEAFRKFLAQPEVEAALNKCKKEQSRKR